MALKITLKAGERMILGGALVVNANRSNCKLVIENNVPILRQNNIMRAEEADTPCRRIYFSIQLMYIDEANHALHQKTFWELVKEVTTAAPSTTGLIDQIGEHILQNRYYQALKLTKELIEYEQKVVNRVSKPI